MELVLAALAFAVAVVSLAIGLKLRGVVQHSLAVAAAASRAAEAAGRAAEQAAARAASADASAGVLREEIAQLRSAIEQPSLPLPRAHPPSGDLEQLRQRLRAQQEEPDEPAPD